LKELSATKTKPKFNTEIIITVYEETGHGNSWVNPDITEMIAVDMGCIGLDLACSERDVSICAKDSSGPYDYAMTTHLSNLAKQENIRAVVDIYPFYGSDVSAALRGGNNLRGALIGPGVGASHGMERTHLDALQATHDLVLAYMKQPA
ncbi:MAG: aminopeptidase, partial [Erysipelotrichaceae bacterium]|nr:aminopeptidase [Erysipelotrichaceae bacterium]